MRVVLLLVKEYTFMFMKHNNFLNTPILNILELAHLHENQHHVGASYSDSAKQKAEN